MALTLQTSDSSLQDRRKTILTLQWTVVIVTSYIALFNKGQLVQDLRVFVLVGALLLSPLVLYRIPERLLSSRYFPYAVVIVDTIMVAVGIGLNRETPWDLFLLFFFVIFIAGIGENLVHVMIGCVVVSILFVALGVNLGAYRTFWDPELIMRVPFMFGISILYGFLAEQVKVERNRAEKAEATERLKRQMVSALAHDIKNPLGVIQGYAENVASHLDERPENRGDLESLERIQDNVQRIVKLVTGFLDASKAEAGRLEAALAPVQLNRLIREVIEQQSGDMRRRNLSLKMELQDGLPEVMGDSAQLDRVLWNLVGNAIKFTPVGGSITIRSGREEDHVRVSVSDTGMGIPKEELPLLFSEYRRLKGAGKIEGTGLGLFIVKTIVEAHGGTVGVESEEGKGTAFHVRLPLSH